MNLRSKNYIFYAILMVFAAVVVELCNIPYIKPFLHQLYDYMRNIYILIPAIICAMVLMRTGAYWLLVAMCGILDVVYMAHSGGYSVTQYGITIPIFISFMLIVFIINVIKAIFSN